ncbi:putative alanine rich protein [Mycobacterium tuberculosis]|nr:putative alanine rich protein [Mycobacterium tuberculosis]
MGPWWAAPSAALRAAAQHWATWAMQKQELARNLISQHDLLLRNQGRTAEDLIGRYLRGAKSEVTKAEKYEIKKGAFNTAADAIDYLRSRLTGIAGEGNKEIDDVLASKKPLPEQLAEIQAIQTRCNADAANASRDAVDKVMTAMQEILEAEDIGDDPRTWARANGFNVDDAPPPRLIRENDLAALTGPGARGGSFGSVEGAGDLASPQSVGAGGFSGSGVQAACSQPAPRAIGASSRHASAGPVPPAPVVQHPPLLHRQSSPLAPGGDARRVAVAGGPRTGRIAYVDWAIVCDRDGDGATGRGWRAFAVGRGNDGDAVGVGSPAAGHSSDNDTARGVCADHGCGHRSHTRAS